MTEPQRHQARPPTAAAIDDLNLGPCRCGQPAIVTVGGGRSIERPLCLRCFGGLLNVARSIGDLARDAGVDVVVNVSLNIERAAQAGTGAEIRRFAG